MPSIPGAYDVTPARLSWVWSPSTSYGIIAALDELIVVINTLPTPPRYWARHPPLPPASLTKTNRSIQGGPLLDLAAIQQAIASGQLSEDTVWVATDGADEDLYKLQWDTRRVCDLICALEAGDYHASEWATSSSNSTHACDAYAINFDDEAGVRDWRGPEYYIKFSLNAIGITICLISCHLSD
jgi:hypothetical protein